MKKWRGLKSGLLAVVCGVYMMTVPVCAEEQKPFAEHASVLDLQDPCPCGAEITYLGATEVGYAYYNDTYHYLKRNHYYQCRYGHVQCIESTVEQLHTNDWYGDKGHYTYPDELFGEHHYAIKCVCGKEQAVTIFCQYPGNNSHNTPF